MAWLGLFGKSDPMKFRGKVLLELGRTVPSEASLIQELTIAKAATLAGGLTPEGAAQALAKAYVFYCLTGEVFQTVMPTPRYAIVKSNAAEILGQMPGPYPQMVREWVTYNWHEWFSEYAA